MKEELLSVRGDLAALLKRLDQLVERLTPETDFCTHPREHLVDLRTFAAPDRWRCGLCDADVKLRRERRH